jgi:hypothetical protein
MVAVDGSAAAVTDEVAVLVAVTMAAVRPSMAAVDRPAGTTRERAALWRRLGWRVVEAGVVEVRLMQMTVPGKSVRTARIRCVLGKDSSQKFTEPGRGSVP